MDTVEAAPQEPGHSVGIVDVVMELQLLSGPSALGHILQVPQLTVHPGWGLTVEHHGGTKGDRPSACNPGTWVLLKVQSQQSLIRVY